MDKGIKFRTFGKEYNNDNIQMRYSDNYPDLGCFWTLCVGQLAGEIYSKNIMQYTGLNCNGYDWYEGDILENDGDWYVIAWDTEQARWEAEGMRSTGESLALCELLSQETFVQGNIYENPKLLEEVCETCGGTGEVTTMERVYANEPHEAPIGSAPCPDCSSRGDDEYDNQE